MLSECPAIFPPSTRSLKQLLFDLLRSSTTLRHASQVHSQIIVRDLSPKTFLLAELLSLYVSLGRLPCALSTFERINNPGTAAWNRIIVGYARGDQPRESFEFCCRMVGAGVLSDEYTYSSVLRACVREGMLREGVQIHGRAVKEGHCGNVFVKANLVGLYGGLAAEGGGMRYAQKVFDEMGERNVVCWNSLLLGYLREGDYDSMRKVFDEMPERNVISWTAVISGFAKDGKCRQALSLFQLMRRKDMELDQVALIAALTACAELGDLEQGRWIHLYILEKICMKGGKLLVSLNNALIHMYASCGLIDEAYKIFRKMPCRTTVSWTSVITGFAKHGFADGALSIFQMMLSLEKEDVKPDEVTFLGVLGACSRAGYVNEACHIFESMSTKWGIEPRIGHFGCMVDILSRAGHVEEAYKLIASMPLKPNEAIWGALLTGCRPQRNPEISALAARNLMELNPCNVARYLSLLSECYNAASHSWIQVGEAVHDFTDGDTTHRHADSIYRMLLRITQVRQEGHSDKADWCLGFH
ncbi:hypothetical protein MLD38_027999 [Melastoma candidum]|uniref:Uncharacterized protein n=1 Tax=Melastoma candidum TaxID=119954 RepID=A0ACB9MZU1_9MYRT|nr:hypothetical protein MLD38_027999 [Melastoma candidum]